MFNPQLETFLHVADAGSFAKAAEELFITPYAGFLMRSAPHFTCKSDTGSLRDN